LLNQKIDTEESPSQAPSCPLVSANTLLTKDVFYMTTEDAIELVEETLMELEADVKYSVFDEWVLIKTTPITWNILKYRGPRRKEFFQHFAEDLSSLRKTMKNLDSVVGEFNFSREGYGKAFDAYMCIGKKQFILFNNTVKNADEIKANIRWKDAKSHFRTLQRKFIDDPVLPEKKKFY